MLIIKKKKYIYIYISVGIPLRLQGKFGFPYNVKTLMVKYVLLC